MLLPNASPAWTALAAAHFDRNATTPVRMNAIRARKGVRRTGIETIDVSGALVRLSRDAKTTHIPAILV